MRQHRSKGSFYALVVGRAPIGNATQLWLLLLTILAGRMVPEPPDTFQGLETGLGVLNEHMPQVHLPSLVAAARVCCQYHVVPLIQIFIYCPAKIQKD
jgi:hypothetical protein